MAKQVIKVLNEDTVLNMTVTEDMILHDMKSDGLFVPDMAVLGEFGRVTGTLKQVVADGGFTEITVVAPVTTVSEPKAKTTKKKTKTEKDA